MGKILITGSAGFIGHHIAKRLLTEGCDVVGCDSFNDYYPAVVKRQREAELSKHPRYKCHEIDLADNNAVQALFAQESIGMVIHLAAQAGVRYARINPGSYIQSNLVAFVNICEAVRQAGITRLFYASSSSVYAGVKEVPYQETQRTDCPVSLYAATKKSNELMAHSYTHLYGFQTIGLRFFTVYGPCGRPDMAYWSFTERLMDGLPIPIFNFGNMRRDFTYIDDIVGGVVQLLVSEKLNPCEVLNIGNNQSEELLDFVTVLGSALGVDPVCEMKPMMPEDVEETYASIDRIQEVCGYKPQTSIREGIPQFVDWYRSNPGLTQAVRKWRQLNPR